jgi:hypothetical protein
MRILTLIIKETYLDQIVAGAKKLETREPKPNTFKKYYEYDSEGNEIGLRPYDAIQFYAGYRADRKAALVEIKSSELIILVDEDTDADITYMVKDEEYVSTLAEYTLDKILSKQNF